jgi:diadenosine tetraphosphate (Ap4A) HIT family hydrolase
MVSLTIFLGHARTILDMPDQYLADIGPVLKKVAKATGAEQWNVLQNNGKMAFQVRCSGFGLG